MTSLLDPHDLTPAERLIIARRRDDMTQDDAATFWEVPRDLYKRWESGRYDGPMVLLGELDPHEECFLLRRRARITRRDLAETVGVSLQWLTLMERGRAPVQRLLTHWSQRLNDPPRRRRRSR